MNTGWPSIRTHLSAAVCGLTIMAALTVPALAQEPKGWVEGTVLDPEKKTVGGSIGYSVPLEIKLIGPTNVATNSDKSLNGFYTFRDLRPGVYEVFVAESRTVDGRHMRPQHIHGLVVKPGVRTMLAIQVHEGDALEELGTPVAPSQPAVFVPKELDRLQKEVDALKRELAVVNKKD